MKVVVDGITYETIYYPFYRKSKSGLFGIRYPSGNTEDVVIFDKSNYKKELEKFLLMTLKEYGLEEDDMLTEKAKELKNDIRALFGID